MTDRSAHPENWEEVAVDYLAGRLSSDETARVEAHLEVCDTCRRDLTEQRSIASLLGRMPEAAPPPELESKILGRLEPSPSAAAPGAGEPKTGEPRIREPRAHTIWDRLRLRPAVWLPAAAMLFIALTVVGVTSLQPGMDSESALESADSRTSGEVPTDRGKEAEAGDGADEQTEQAAVPEAEGGQADGDTLATDSEDAVPGSWEEILIEVRSDDPARTADAIASFLGVEPLGPELRVDGPTFVVRVEEEFLDELIAGLENRPAEDATVMVADAEAETAYRDLISSYGDPELVVPADTSDGGEAAFEPAPGESYAMEETDDGGPEGGRAKILVVVSVVR